MSALSKGRQEIAAALSTGNYIGYVNVPVAPAPGDAWPLIESMEAAGPPGLFTTTWRVLVVVGGDYTDLDYFMEQNAVTIADLLAPVAYVQSITPVMVSTSAGELAAVEYRVTRE